MDISDRKLNPLGAPIYPDASKAAQERATHSEEVEYAPIIDAKAMKEAKPWWKLDADDHPVTAYVISNVIAPAVRDIAFDAGKTILSMLLYQSPDKAKSLKRKDGYINFASSYNGSSYSYVSNSSSSERNTTADKYRNKLDIYNIVLASDDPDDPGDISASYKGWQVIDDLKERMKLNEGHGMDRVARVSDLYDILHISDCPSTMTEWGWYNLEPESGVDVIKKGGRWVLKMPRPKHL